MAVTIRRAMQVADVDAAYALAARTFGPNYFESEANQRLIRELEPLRSMADVIVAVEGNEVVGFVRIVDRHMSLGDTTLPIGGITSVSVHPQYQGKGYGRAMMEYAIDRSRGRGDVLSVAFARRAVDGFYSPLGYLGMGSHPEMRVTVGGALESRSPIDHGFNPESISAYSDSYDQSYLTLPFQFGRDPSWWQGLARRMSHRLPDASFRAFLVAGEVAGYAILKGNIVFELASAKGAEPEILNELRESSPSDELLLRLPTRHWAVRASRSSNHTLVVRHSWDGGHLARIIDAPALCAALARAGVDERQLQPIREADTRDHQQALRALQQLVGATADGSNDPMVATPAWSSLDEF